MRQALKRYPNGDKQFIELLLYAKEHGVDKVDQACREADSQGICQAKLIIESLAKPVSKKALAMAEMVTLSHAPESNVEAYNALCPLSSTQEMA